MRKAVLYALLCLMAAAGLSAQKKKAHANTAPDKAVSVAAAPVQPQKSALDKATMEAYVRHQFMLDQMLKVKVSDPRPSELPNTMMVTVTVSGEDGNKRPFEQNVDLFVSADGTKLFQAKVFDVRESPFASELKNLGAGNAPVLGPEAAPVSVVIFSDFQCQYCREEAKTLRANLTKEYPAQAKLVFKDFPLEAIHPWARQASRAGKCIQKLNPAAFWEYHDWIFEQQPDVTPENLRGKVFEYANGKGIDTLQLTQCFDGKLPDKDIDANIADARTLAINSTPTLFVNGRRMVGNVTWEQLKRVIDYELDYAKKHPEEQKKKDEACCELKLPIPVVK